MAFELSRSLAWWLGPYRAGAATDSANIDTAFVFETSGDAFFVRFNSPVSQSSGTLTIYLYIPTGAANVTGTPTYQMHVRNAYSGSGDADRPATGGSSISSSPSTLTLGDADEGTWVSMSCTVSLTLGHGYYVLVTNTHCTPASNYAVFRYRGAFEGFSAHASIHMNGGFTTDGFATDPTVLTAAGAMPTVVLKFDDGSLIGNPYVVSDGSHANNSNDRGNRFTTTEDVVVSGMSRPPATSAFQAATIYTAGGASVVSAAGDAHAEAGSNGMYRFAPTTLTGGTAYDCVIDFASNSASGTIYSMGQAEGSVPADVKSCRPWSIAYVDGATPGSYTVDTSKLLLNVCVLVDDAPAIAGGSGGNANIFGGSVVR